MFHWDELTLLVMRLKIIIILVVVSSIAYANSINNGFVYDDKSSIVDNPYIRDISNIPGSFLHPEYLTSVGIRNHYRPLVVISHTINYAIGGLNPAVFRVTNLLLHIGSAFLLYLVVEAILTNTVKRSEGFPSASYPLPATSFIALAAALIFAVHPFNSEAVNYIVARSSLLSGFFYLLAFFCWVRYRQAAPTTNHKQSAIYYVFSVLTFSLGMLSKEVVITLPFALMLYDMYFLNQGRTPRSAISILLNWRTYIPYFPFILFLILPLVMRIIHAEGGVVPPFRRDIGTQIYTVLPVLVGYLKLMFIPTGLTIAHAVEVYNTPLAAKVASSAIVLLLFILNASYLYMRKETEWRLLSFFMFWYFITLLIVLIVPLNRIMQENRSYISSAWFAIFAGIALWKLVYDRQMIRLAYSLLIVLIILYSAGTIYRNTAWGNSVSIWTDAMEKSPDDPLVYNNLSVAYKDIQEYNKAREVLKRGVLLLPDDWLLHYNLGIAYKVTGEFDRALTEFGLAIRIRPNSAAAYTMIGSVFINRGQIKEALNALDIAINGRPDYAPAHYYKAKALLTLGRTEEAKREINSALHYANMSYDISLAERINGYLKEGPIESIKMEDLSMPLDKKDNS